MASATRRGTNISAPEMVMLHRMSLSLAALRRLPARTAWLVVAVDAIQYGGIALAAIPLAAVVYLVAGVTGGGRGRP
jgi:hypothetical protein